MSDLCGRFQRDSYLRSIGDQILSVNLGGFRKRAGKLTNQLQLFVASSYRAGLGDQVSEWLERRRCETKVELLVLCATFRGHINPVRDEMFIDTWLLTFHSSVECNVFRDLISLLRSWEWFMLSVAINILLLRS